MDEAEIERILRASRTPLSGAPRSRVAKRVSHGVRAGGAGAQRREIRATQLSRMPGSVDAVKRRLSETEVKRLHKAIRTSFCNSPHKKWYWTALVDMYTEESIGPG